MGYVAVVTHQDTCPPTGTHDRQLLCAHRRRDTQAHTHAHTCTQMPKPAFMQAQARKGPRRAGKHLGHSPGRPSWQPPRPLPESCGPAAGHPTACSPHAAAQVLPGQAASLGSGTAETLPLGQGREPCAPALGSGSGWGCTAAAPQYTPDQTRQPSAQRGGGRGGCSARGGGAAQA